MNQIVDDNGTQNNSLEYYIQLPDLYPTPQNNLHEQIGMGLSSNHANDTPVTESVNTSVFTQPNPNPKEISDIADANQSITNITNLPLNPTAPPNVDFSYTPGVPTISPPRLTVTGINTLKRKTPTTQATNVVKSRKEHKENDYELISEWYEFSYNSNHFLLKNLTHTTSLLLVN